jgi:Glycosyl transferase family 2
MITDSVTLVMPHFKDSGMDDGVLEETLESLFRQTDRGWRLVVVDDASPDPQVRERLRELERGHPGRIAVIPFDEHRGAGACRNAGVRWANDRDSCLVLFQDADDVAHPRRVELTRLLFSERPDVDFVYSSFTVVDERGDEVPAERISPSILEILQSHRDPVEGEDAWIPIGTETGYTTLTSTVAIRTWLGIAYPFPEVACSEDSHTWLRMLAGGHRLAYLRDVPARYRTPQWSAGSSDRSRVGPGYYQVMAEVDTAGFAEAMRISLRRGRIQPHQVPDLSSRFLTRLAVTMRGEGQVELADRIGEAARVAAAGSLLCPDDLVSSFAGSRVEPARGRRARQASVGWARAVEVPR